MKSFDKFDKFQLGKSEMKVLRGGGYFCSVDWGDYTVQYLYVEDDNFVPHAAEKVLKDSNPGAKVNCFL